MSDDNEEIGMVFAFTDQSQSYCAGFEAGMVWQQIQNGEQEIDKGFFAGFPVREENLEMYARMAAASGYTMETRQSGCEGWVNLRLVNQPRIRPILKLVEQP